MRNALAALVLVAPALAFADYDPAGSTPPAPEQPPPQRSPSDPADGGAGYFAAPSGRDIIITSREDRSKTNLITIGALVGGGAVFGAIGVYYNLDARDAANDVSAKKATGEVWDADHEATFQRAHDSSVRAGICYGIGGSLLIGAAIFYIATEPKETTTLIHPHANPKRAMIAPTPGGALVGVGGSF